MGYYARARNLHRAACHVVEELGGQLPPAPKGLLLLPGVGQYTAAAIASIAFGYDAIALDANLRRILCRLFAVDDDPSRSNTQRHLEKLARAMLPAGQASDFNQALMDLGSAVCTASQPRCLLCPLIGLCEAQSEGIQNELPIRAPRGQRPHRDVTAAVLRDGRDQLLITQRLLDGLLGGLWEFPGGKRRPGEGLQDCLRREIREELCIDIQVGELLCTIEHAFTHFFMTLYAYECQWISGEPQCLGCRDLRWVTLEELGAFAFPAADQKIIAYLLENHE
jgi:A/G-specific adenine glycosylase